MKKLAWAALTAVLACAAASAEGRVSLRYAFVNTLESITGRMASSFAELVAERTRGAVEIEVFPNSQLGGIPEMAEQTRSGAIAFHTATPSALAAFYGSFAVLDAPYLFRGPDEMMKALSLGSPLMSKLSGGLLSSSGLRVLGVFYFGTRQLTCDRPIRRPEDLAGVKIRAIPYPVYETIVEGLGATAVPMEWSATPTALAAKVVSGQENPVNTILNSRLYESQSYIMLTGHQISLGIFVANEQTFQRLSREQREIVQRTALEVCDKASKATMAQEADDLSALLAKGIKLIGPDQGLDLAAFRNRATKLAWERFGAGWREFYELTDRTK